MAHAGAPGPEALASAYAAFQDRGIDAGGLAPEAVEAWFLDRQPGFERIRAAAGRPGLGFRYENAPPSDPEDRLFLLDPETHDQYEAIGWARTPPAFPGLEVQLPHLTHLRTIARLLAADAVLAIEAGDPSRAIADLTAMHELARQLHAGPSLIEQLVALAIEQLALEGERALLAADSITLDEAALVSLAELLEARPVPGGPDLSGESQMFADIIQRLYSDDGAGDGTLMVTGSGISPLGGGGGLGGGAPAGGGPGLFGVVIDPFVGLLVLSRREATDLHGAYHDAVTQGGAEPLHAVDWVTLDQLLDCMTPRGTGLLGSLETFPVNLLAANLNGVLPTFKLVGMDREANRVVVALLRHRARSGAWPDSLEVLVPEFLPAVPADVYDGAPLRYALREGRPLLWSVGADRIDDDGRVPVADAEADDAARAFRRPDEAEQGPMGDWILWRGPARP